MPPALQVPYQEASSLFFYDTGSVSSCRNKDTSRHILDLSQRKEDHQASIPISAFSSPSDRLDTLPKAFEIDLSSFSSFGLIQF